VRQTLTTGGDHIESPADLETPPTIIRRSSLSWPRGLQQNSFCSTRMKNHCTRETRKATHLGTPRTTWLFIGSRDASLPMSKCIHLFHGVDTLEFFPHNYRMPQLSSTDRLIMAAKDMTDALQNSHPEVPFTHVRDDTISAPDELATIFKLKLWQTPPPTLPLRLPRSTTHMPCRIIQSNRSFSHAPDASDEITDNNSHTRHNHCAITPEGGHTKDTQPITSEGAPSLAESLSPHPVPKRLLRNGHCPYGHRPWK
jgi:hypothetical protein